MAGQKLHKLLFEPNTVGGVELILESNNQYHFRLAVLSKAKNLISINRFEENIKDIKSLKQQLPENIPVSLVINGRTVQSEKTDRASSNKQVVRKILTNANEDDFYLQRITVSEDIQMASIIRKEILEEIVSKFKEQQIPIINISIGPFCIGTIYPMIKQNGQEDFDYAINGHLLTFYKKRILDYKETADTTNGEILHLGEQELPKRLAIAFAGAFQQLSKAGAVSLEAPLVREQRSQWQQKRLFRPLGYGILGFFLVLSFANFSIFSYLNDEVKTLTYQVGNKQEQLLYLETLREELKIKKDFLQKAGWLKPSKTSFYADRIAKTIPRSVQLELLSVYPQIRDMQSTIKKTYRFETDKIAIKGTSREVDSFNQWIEEMRKLEWVKSVVVEYYREQSRSINSQFSIQLFI